MSIAEHKPPIILETPIATQERSVNDIVDLAKQVFVESISDLTAVITAIKANITNDLAEAAFQNATKFFDNTVKQTQTAVVHAEKNHFDVRAVRAIMTTAILDT